MDDLASKKCVACQGGIPPLKGSSIDIFASKVNPEWKVIEEHHIEKEFKFKDFKEALAFVDKVGAIAEEEQHHPNIELSWGKVKVILWTHKIDGLHENDFIMAAKIDEI